MTKCRALIRKPKRYDLHFHENYVILRFSENPYESPSLVPFSIAGHYDRVFTFVVGSIQKLDYVE